MNLIGVCSSIKKTSETRHGKTMNLRAVCVYTCVCNRCSNRKGKHFSLPLYHSLKKTGLGLQVLPYWVSPQEECWTKKAAMDWFLMLFELLPCLKKKIKPEDMLYKCWESCDLTTWIPGLRFSQKIIHAFISYLNYMIQVN